MATGKETAKKTRLNMAEKAILRYLYNDIAPWSQIYCKEVDALFRKGLITWKYESPKGQYYNSVMITKLGKQMYDECTTKDSHRI